MNYGFAKEKYMVHKNEPKEDIERCLRCPYPDCTDTCPHSPYYRAPKPKKKRKSFREQYIAKLDISTKKRAEDVTNLFMDGWTENGIAWKLGLTVAEVEESLKIARKIGILT